MIKLWDEVISALSCKNSNPSLETDLLGTLNKIAQVAYEEGIEAEKNRVANEIETARRDLRLRSTLNKPSVNSNFDPRFSGYMRDPYS